MMVMKRLVPVVMHVPRVMVMPKPREGLLLHATICVRASYLHLICVHRDPRSPPPIRHHHDATTLHLQGAAFGAA
jgi:hypothetical protein